jgi:hypothetical protein
MNPAQEKPHLRQVVDGVAQAVKALTRHKTAYIGESSVTVTGDKANTINHNLKKGAAKKEHKSRQ